MSALETPLCELLATMDRISVHWDSRIEVERVAANLRAYVTERTTARRAIYDCELTLESIRPYRCRHTTATARVLRAWADQAKAVTS